MQEGKTSVSNFLFDVIIVFFIFFVILHTHKIEFYHVDVFDNSSALVHLLFLEFHARV